MIALDDSAGKKTKKKKKMNKDGQTTDERQGVVASSIEGLGEEAKTIENEWMMIGLKGKWAAGTLVSLSSLCTLPVNILSYQHDPGTNGWMGVAVVISKLSLL